jgi:hypothetical protein
MGSSRFFFGPVIAKPAFQLTDAVFCFIKGLLRWAKPVLYEAPPELF